MNSIFKLNLRLRRGPCRLVVVLASLEAVLSHLKLEVYRKILAAATVQCYTDTIRTSLNMKSCVCLLLHGFPFCTSIGQPPGLQCQRQQAPE